MEYKTISENFLVKSDKSKNTVISGYASVFNVVDNQNDIVEKGAFTDTITEKVRLLWQHDQLKPIGIIKALHEDSYGLKVEAEINNRTICGNEAAELVKQKAITSLSIGFRIKDFAYNKQGIRLLKKLDLAEISLVTFPANVNANITDVKGVTNNSITTSLAKLEKLVCQLISLRAENVILLANCKSTNKEG